MSRISIYSEQQGADFRALAPQFPDVPEQRGWTQLEAQTRLIGLLYVAVRRMRSMGRRIPTPAGLPEGLPGEEVFITL